MRYRSKHYQKTLNFLHFKCRYHQHVALQIITEYGQSLGLHKGRDARPFYEESCEKIQSNWDAFMKFFKGITSKYHSKENKVKKFKKRQHHMSCYTEWWDFNNLNGGFAYNNAADDF